MSSVALAVVTKWKPSDRVLNLTPEQIEEIRSRLNIDVSVGAESPPAPAPIELFSDMCLYQSIMDDIAIHGYTIPTSIQAQALPVALSGRDLLVSAETGSGKTAAYAIAMIQHCLAHAHVLRGDAPLALVLAPTIQVAQQIEKEVKAFSQSSSLRTVFMDGINISQQEKTRVDIVVATPASIADHLQQGNTLAHLSYIVLDEADRMLEMGFQHQIREVMNHVPSKHQTLVLSAPLLAETKSLAEEFLTDPVHVRVAQNEEEEAITPIYSFLGMGLDRRIITNLSKKKNLNPTLIQAHTIPIAMKGRDIFGCFPKDLPAFIVPLLQHCIQKSSFGSGDGPIALVVAPTIDAANEIGNEVKNLSQSFEEMRSVTVVGGERLIDQRLKLSDAQIIISTPRRLIGHLEEGNMSVANTSFLVLYELHKMIEMGFQLQISQVMDHLPLKRQTLLLSANISAKIQVLAKELLTNPVQVNEGVVAQNEEEEEEEEEAEAEAIPIPDMREIAAEDIKARLDGPFVELQGPVTDFNKEIPSVKKWLLQQGDGVDGLPRERELIKVRVDGLFENEKVFLRDGVVEFAVDGTEIIPLSGAMAHAVLGIAIGACSMKCREISLFEVPSPLGFGTEGLIVDGEIVVPPDTKVLYRIQILKIEYVDGVYLHDDENIRLWNAFYCKKRRRQRLYPHQQHEQHEQQPEASVQHMWELRKDKGISVRGCMLEHPISCWSEIKVGEGLNDWLKTIGYANPTPIQSQLVPQMLSSTADCVFVTAKVLEARVGYIVALVMEKGSFGRQLVLTDDSTDTAIKGMVDEIISSSGSQLSPEVLLIVTPESYDKNIDLSGVSVLVVDGDGDNAKDKEAILETIIGRLTCDALQILVRGKKNDAPQSILGWCAQHSANVIEIGI